MSLLSILISIGTAIILGVLLAFIITKLLIGNKKKKIVRDAYAKILKQDQKFILDGKEYNLKAEIQKGMKGSGPEIEKIVEESIELGKQLYKDLKKPKKKKGRIKKSGSFKKKKK